MKKNFKKTIILLVLIFILLLSAILIVAMVANKGDNEEENKNTPNDNKISDYNISFNSCGGSAVVSFSVNEDGTLQEPSAPTKEGYEFAGWFVDGCYSQTFDFSAPVENNLTLYAGWINYNDFIVSERDGDKIALYVGGDANVIVPSEINGVQIVGIGGFSSNPYIVSATIQDGITTILDEAFYDCSALMTVTLPNSVNKIGVRAFQYCNKLIEICNASNLSLNLGSDENGYIAYYAKNIYSPSFGTSKIYANGDYLFYANNNEVWLLDYFGTETDLTLPQDYNGQNYGIYVGAFYLKNLHSVIISQGVTSVEFYAFWECYNLTRVVVSNTVEHLGDWAFKDCYSLESVEFGNGLTSLGVDVFLHDSAISYVNYTGTIEQWANIYFGNQSSTPISSAHKLYINGDEVLSEDITNSSITKVNNYAFSYIRNWTSLVLPNTLETLCEGAFEGCRELTSITIPASVTSIGECAFYENYSLREINFNATNCEDFVYQNRTFSFSGQSGSGITVIFGDNVTKIPAYLFCPYDKDSYAPNIKSVEFRSNITSIGAYAFSYVTNLTEISLPASVTSIGEYAFNNCTSLNSVTLPENITSIEDGAFQNCTSLNLANLSACTGLTTISSNIFNNCTSLNSVTLPENITSIGDSAFQNCYSLTSITLQKNIISIGNYAFQKCSNLTSITIPANVTSIGTNAFQNCYDLVEVINKSSLTITAGKNTNGYVAYYAKHVITSEADSNLQTIGGVIYYISGSSYIAVGLADANSTSVTLKEDTTEIYKYAFYNCTSLTSITIPANVTKIDTYAFSGCTNLSSISVLASLTTLGNYAFQNCVSLTSVDLSACVKLTTIGSSAFSGCSSLNSVTIPEKVTKIQTNAFQDCYRLAEVVNKSGLTLTIGGTDYGYITYYAKNIISGEEDSKLQVINGVIYYIDGTNYIAVGLADAGLTSIVLNSNTTEIGANAFRGCTNLISVDMSNCTNLTTIDAFAIYYCTSLTSIIIPNGVTSIGDHALSNNNNLQYNVYDNGYYLGNAENPYLVLMGTVNIQITSCEINENTKIIYYEAFFNCANLTSIIISASVISIGERAFNQCYRLVEVVNKSGLTLTLGETTNGYVAYYALGIVSSEGESKLHDIGGVLYYINESDFVAVGLSNENLTKIVLDSNTTAINSYAFYKYDISLISISSEVTVIGDYAFSGCKYLVSVIIFGDVTSIGSYAFSGCNILSLITLPNSLTTIGSYAFQNCYGLTLLDLSACNGLTTIESYVFSGCRGLTKILLPESVTSIGNYAFQNCYSLTSITITANVESIGIKAFYNCYKLVEVVNKSNLEFTANGTSNGYVTYYAKNIISAKEDSKLQTINGVVYYVDEGENSYIAVGLADASLTKIELSANTTEINSYAFYYCSDLSSITISASVKNIGSGAFSNCTNLATVIIESEDIYNSATSNSACGGLLSHANTIMVSKSVVDNDSNSNNYLNDIENFTKTESNNYYVYTIIE